MRRSIDYEADSEVNVDAGSCHVRILPLDPGDSFGSDKEKWLETFHLGRVAQSATIGGFSRYIPHRVYPVNGWADSGAVCHDESVSSRVNDPPDAGPQRDFHVWGFALKGEGPSPLKWFNEPEGILQPQSNAYGGCVDACIEPKGVMQFCPGGIWSQQREGGERDEGEGCEVADTT